MTEQTQLTELQKKLARMQAQIDALQKSNIALEEHKAAWQEDKVEMQARIDHLLAELKLSKSQKYGKKVKNHHAAPSMKPSNINRPSPLSIIKKANNS